MTATIAITPMAIRSAIAIADGCPEVAEIRSKCWRCLFARGDEHFLDMFPVHQMVEKCLQIVRPPISIVNVIGMLPNVAAEYRRRPVHERILAIGRLADDQLAVLHRDPSPAGAELRDAGLGKVFLHLGDAAEITVDLRLELAGNLVAATIRLHPFPEMDVVVMLAGIVEEPSVFAEGRLDHFLE